METLIMKIYEMKNINYENIRDGSINCENIRD